MHREKLAVTMSSGKDTKVRSNIFRIILRIFARWVEELHNFSKLLAVSLILHLFKLR
jgi:hypothetical protein